jgi:dCMP deaminase
MNAIAQAAASGTAISGCEIYVTHEPCSICSKLLINAGCRRVVFMNPYPDELSRTLRSEAGLPSEPFENHAEVQIILKNAVS